MTFTRKQIDAITRLQQSRITGHPDKEVKKFRVLQIGKDAFVAITVGYRDEPAGTIASLARQHGTFSVGPRGGITAHDKARWATAEQVRKYPDICGFHSLL